MRNAFGESRIRSKLWLAKSRLKALEIKAATPSQHGSAGQVVETARRPSRPSRPSREPEQGPTTSRRALARRISLLIGAPTVEGDEDGAAVSACTITQSPGQSSRRTTGRTVPVCASGSTHPLAPRSGDVSPAKADCALVDPTARAAPAEPALRVADLHAAPTALPPESGTLRASDDSPMRRAAIALLFRSRNAPSVELGAAAGVDLEAAVSETLRPRDSPASAAAAAGTLTSAAGAHSPLQSPLLLASASATPLPSALPGTAQLATARPSPPLSLIDQWREAISKFDVRLATAYVASDKEMLLTTIEAGFSSHELFNAAVIGVLSSVIETSIVANGNQQPLNTISEARARTRAVGAGVNLALRASKCIGGRPSSRQQNSGSMRSDADGSPTCDGKKQLAKQTWTQASTRSASVLPFILRKPMWSRASSESAGTAAEAAASTRMTMPVTAAE